jgi:hypothetical protein
MKNWKTIMDLPKVIPVAVPDGKKGDWSVETFTVSKEDEEFGRLRAMFSSERGRCVPAGTYKALKRNGATVMSNAPDEIRDQWPFFRAATGSVLINGLGLGISLTAILAKINEDGSPAVNQVVVVENSPEVLDLVSPTFKKDLRVFFVLGDPFKFTPRGKFDVVYHDIWDDICSDNLSQMHKLHRKYGRKAKWQGSWCRERCEWNAERTYC